MAFIVQRFNDYRLQLAREELIRPMSFGTNWGALRIAMLCTLNGSSGTFASTQSTTGFNPVCMGISQGTFGILSDNTVDAFYGSTGVSGTAWTFTTSGAINYYATSGGLQVFQKFGGALTAGPQATSQVLAVAADTLSTAGGSLVRTPICMDIIKTSLTAPTTTYTVTLYGPNAAQIGDVSEDTWFDRIQTYSTPTGMTTIAVSTVQPTGNLAHDNVFIAWNRFVPVLEISAWSVIRFD